ncbi:MAG: cytochrome P450 [Deltaproteobacteria bacterium]|nr:cytochrome P450 [Deltaproteobacteria bacterium]
MHPPHDVPPAGQGSPRDLAAPLESELPRVDPTALDYWRDTHAVLAPLRERWPVVRSTAGDFEVLRYEHVESGLRDPQMRQALYAMLANQGITSGPLYGWWQHLTNALDPPEHTRLRGLVGRAFTPRQVARLRPQIRAMAHRLIDEAADAGEVDLVATFCHALPLEVLCAMVGIEAGDRALFERWTDTVSNAFSAVIPPASRTAIEQAIVEFDAAASELIERRRRAQESETLLDALIAAEEAGERLSNVELRGLILNLLFAGHDTTKSLLANALWTLADHPDELAKLRADPALVPSAVEEVARYETPIPSIPRIATEGLTIEGVVIPPGAYVAFSVPSANRDPRRFVEPDRFDVTRNDSRHFTFGHGVHHCVGAAIARAEIQEALSALLERGFALEPCVDRPEWTAFLSTRRVAALPARFRVARGNA